jgi:hypothetical protein
MPGFYMSITAVLMKIYLQGCFDMGDWGGVVVKALRY